MPNAFADVDAEGGADGPAVVTSVDRELIIILSIMMKQCFNCPHFPKLPPG